ncbi:sulfite exporter TauE/SafE family protein [Candidatus Uhrbacteria bacterium]|nr:sulfite exporter TauE/SafE family protein [Candidatus Uhrbacteria bacterium]
MHEQNRVIKLRVDGMTCHSCELTIERAWRKIDGVLKVDVNATKGVARVVCDDTALSLDALQSAIADHGYTVKGILGATTPSVDQKTLGVRRLSWLQLFGLFALVILLGTLFSKIGLLAPTIALGATTSFGAVFLLGLVAASSSCIAVSGGLLLSSAAKFNERYGSTTPSVDQKTLGVGLTRMRPVFLFVGGRIISYAILGGLIGAIGKALSPSPLATGIITLLAALYMLTMGLDMLHVTPQWLKKITPRLPKSLGHRLLTVEEKEHALTPLLLGAATFFLPCGFTQALQLYALTTGSFTTGALILLAFALGTAPALLVLGWVSGSLKGKTGRFFFQFAGALVIMLGLWNLQNGFTIMGYPISVQRITHLFTTESNAGALDPNVRFDGTQQTVQMAVDYTGYAPSRFTIRQGVPTRWVINAKSNSGCLSVIQAPKLGIRTLLQPGTNVVEFTPRIAGTIPFSCSMGMFWGEINVIPNS